MDTQAPSIVGSSPADRAAFRRQCRREVAAMELSWEAVHPYRGTPMFWLYNHADIHMPGLNELLPCWKVLMQFL